MREVRSADVNTVYPVLDTRVHRGYAPIVKPTTNVGRGEGVRAGFRPELINQCRVGGTNLQLRKYFGVAIAARAKKSESAAAPRLLRPQ